MNFLKLCSDDPLLSLLRETFNANPIRVPEERIKPLVVLSKAKNTTYLGPIGDLLANSATITLTTENSTKANVSAKNSKSVSLDLGLQVMDGFLKGFGVGSGTIKSSFEDTSTVSFSFQNVTRKYVDVTALSKLLKNRKFDPNDAIVKIFINEEAECLIITSVITSDNFTIKKEEQSGTNINFDVNAISDSLSADSKIEVSSSNSLEISFKGKKQLAFAYTAAKFQIHEDGYSSYTTESDKSFLTTSPDEEGEDTENPDYFIEEEFGLSSIEFDD